MRSRLGQNFLADPTILKFEAEEANVKGKHVLEIGAGDGRLTKELLSCGAAKIAAVEIEHKLARALRMRFHMTGKVSVLEGDVLEFDFAERFDSVVGNIPYYITSPILVKLARMDFGKAILCVQKEVAERMIALPGAPNYGRLSVFCQLSFEIEALAVVPREAFTPMPKVDSCVISLKKTGNTLSPQEESAIGAIFSHRKKSLKNAVVDSRQALFSSNDKKAAGAIAQKLKYSERKVFTLTPDEAMESARQLVAK